jgi:hypothetical protein
VKSPFSHSALFGFAVCVISASSGIFKTFLE